MTKTPPFKRSKKATRYSVGQPMRENKVRSINNESQSKTDLIEHLRAALAAKRKEASSLKEQLEGSKRFQAALKETALISETDPDKEGTVTRNVFLSLREKGLLTNKDEIAPDVQEVMGEWFQVGDPKNPRMTLTTLNGEYNQLQAAQTNALAVAAGAGAVGGAQNLGPGLGVDDE